MIRKGCIYFFTVTLLLFVLRTLHYKGLLRQTTGYYAKYKTAFLEKNDFDVLFLGSSRAEMHYDTGLFDSLTAHHSFNLSMAGATPHVAFAALRTYLSNSRPPAYLIYEVDYHALDYESHEVKEFNNYFPFLKNPVFRKEMTRIDCRMEQFYYNPYFSWPFTGLKSISNGLHGWLGIPAKTDAYYYHGFFREVLRPHLTYLAIQKKHAFFNVAERNYLDSIMDCCKRNNIKITLVSSPVFSGGKLELYNKKSITGQLRHIAAIHQLQYLDLSSLSFCNDRSLFIDHYHLNYAGARKFTTEFCGVFNNKIGNPSLN